MVSGDRHHRRSGIGESLEGAKDDSHNCERGQRAIEEITRDDHQVDVVVLGDRNDLVERGLRLVQAVEPP